MGKILSRVQGWLFSANKESEPTNPLNSLEWQLGYFVGEYIISNHLPTLNIDPITTRNTIQVDMSDARHYAELYNAWGDACSENKGSEAQWETLKAYSKELQIKYLPETIECPIAPLNVGDMDEFKQGLRESLWSSDCCSYRISTNKDIEVINNVSGFYSIIRLRRDV
jgi:hypothetical protein